MHHPYRDCAVASSAYVRCWYSRPMQHCRFVLSLSFGILLLTLAACNDDPSGVGLGIGPGFEGGTPVTIDLEPTEFALESIDDVTGNSVRILTGTVDDPALGQITTIGYLDVSPPSTLPDGFEDGTVESAQLVLTPQGATTNIDVPPYVYGDTLAAMQLRIGTMPEAWDANTSDEMLPEGSFLTESVSFSPGDTVRIDLSDAGWDAFASLNDTTDFDDRFHGFSVEATAGNAVVGFARPSSALEVVVDGDTATYATSRTFTHIAQSDVPEHPDRILVQDGVGRALAFSFTLPDSLQNAPISRAELRLPTDTTLFEGSTLPSDFVRPPANDLVLQGFTENDEEILALPDSLRDDGTFVFSSSSEVSLQQIFQQITLGKPSVAHYRLVVSQANNTINPLLFYRPETGENAPRVSLVVTQPDD